MAPVLVQLHLSHCDQRRLGAKAGTGTDLGCRVTSLRRPLFRLLPSHVNKIEGDNRMPCAPLQEGGHIVMGHFPGGTTTQGSGGPAPVDVTGGPGGKEGYPSWSRGACECLLGSKLVLVLAINGKKGGKHRM